MTPAAGIKAIDELSKQLSLQTRTILKINSTFIDVVKDLKTQGVIINVLNEEVRMVKHQYKTPNDERDSLLEEIDVKNQASAIKTIEKNLSRIAESIHGRGVVVLNKVPPKENDPGGALKPTRICIELANKTTQFPKGIAENVVVKIDKFVFPIYFVILDMEEDHKIPIILGRPFLATTHAMIDICPFDEDTCHFADIIDLSVIENIKEILPQNHDNSIKPILDHLPAIHEDCNNPNLFAANSIDEEIPTPKLKELPSHLEYAFLDNNRELPVIISSLLSDQEKSPWVSPIHMVPTKGGTIVITNKDNETIPTRTVTGWRVCIDYRKLNDATRKDHFSLPFIDQMLERLSGNEYYCFLDGFSGYFQIPLAPEDQEKTTFTCPYGTFAYRRMPFGLCNALATFQRCVTTIFHGMCKDFMEVFMDDFSVFENSFGTWHKISKAGIEVDKAKVDVIASLPYPTNVKDFELMCAPESMPLELF
ncbi:reverse transcriptase domain-containing protein [Tanacetum coccineum]